MKVIVFGTSVDEEVKEPAMVCEKEQKEEFIAPLIDGVYDKVMDALKDFTIERQGDRFYVQKGDGSRYALAIDAALVLTPEAIRVDLE